MRTLKKSWREPARTKDLQGLACVSRIEVVGWMTAMQVKDQPIEGPANSVTRSRRTAVSHRENWSIEAAERPQQSAMFLGSCLVLFSWGLLVASCASK